ncbi:MAG: 30S ribosomal protein S2 [Candidatus Yonathbacteria bacterium]|nr:30S ribosomal protein S2 [Candidatus Yonathbacteria bacterium]
MNTKASITDMFEAGAHFGYAKARRHPSMKSFIFGAKNKTEVFDLKKTEEKLAESLAYVATLAEGGKKILFVGGKPEARKAATDAAMALSMPYVASRWIGGTLTNWSEVKKRVFRLEDLSEKREKGELSVYTKKERLLFDREIEDLEKSFGGLRGMKELPHVLFVVDPRAEAIAVAEAKKKNIPVIALASSDCDASLVQHVIPANDSSSKSITLFTNEIVEAYREAQKNVVAKKEETLSETVTE